MVVAAVRSALAQTHAPHEVLVVIDGPEQDARTPEALTRAGLDAVQVVALRASVGGAEARNTGVRKATGAWIAFLDDDDLWLPRKLETQLAALAELRPGCVPVLSCPVLARSPDWQEVWPRRRYRPEEPMAEYLFCRRSWRYGAGLLQTSTLLAPRALLLRLPFTPGLRKHQDWDWLLRAAKEPDVLVHPVGTAPLAVFHVEGQRASVGRVADWRFSLGWALERRQLFTPRALAGFLSTECAAQAGSSGWRGRTAVLWALFRYGSPSFADQLRLLVFLFVPQRVRRSLRDAVRVAGRSGVRASAAG